MLKKLLDMPKTKNIKMFNLKLPQGGYLDGSTKKEDGGEEAREAEDREAEDSQEEDRPEEEEVAGWHTAVVSIARKITWGSRAISGLT